MGGTDCALPMLWALKEGINAQLIFSIASPKEAGMLDVVGFDSATPALMRDFVQGTPNANQG